MGVKFSELPEVQHPSQNDYLVVLDKTNEVLETAKIVDVTSSKLDKADPTGTGSLSINRKSSTTVGTKSATHGNSNTASGSYSHGEGDSTTASGQASHSEGRLSQSLGDNSHAEGESTQANGYATHAEGIGTIASQSSIGQHVEGKFNVQDSTSVLIIGNGEDADSRSNALALDWSGNLVVAGDVTDGSSTKLSSVGTVSSLSTSTKSSVVAAINEVNAVAKGANQSISYSSYEDVVDAFNDAESQSLNIGQNIYVGTVSVPDLWVLSNNEQYSEYTYEDDQAIIDELNENGYIHIGYFKLGMLETQSVDISSITADIEDIQEQLSSNTATFNLDKQGGEWGWNESSSRAAATFHSFGEGASGSTERIPMTQAAYDALPDTKLTDHTPRYIHNNGALLKAMNVPIDEVSGMEAQNVQDAIEELNTANVAVQNDVADLQDQLTANSEQIYMDYHDGKYGINTSAERGADTFIPFKSLGTPTVLNGDIINGISTKSAVECEMMIVSCVATSGLATAFTVTNATLLKTFIKENSFRVSYYGDVSANTAITNNGQYNSTIFQCVNFE